MPVVHRQRLAARLRQNWHTLFPTDSTDQPTTTPTAAAAGMFPAVDDSLTSLAWLQNLNVMKLASRSVSTPATTTPPPPTLPVSLPEKTRGGGGGGDPTLAGYRRGLSAAADDDDGLTRLRVDPNEILDMTNRRSSVETTAASPWGAVPSATAGSSRGAGGVLDPSGSAAGRLERDRYRYDGSMKPPYSYATLICMAMQEAPDRRITLAQIYSWIADNFAFYRQADQNWQHSIRHNLSLNKCFQKVPRGKDEPGKGGFWTLNPDFNSLVDKGIFKKRRLTFACDSSSSSGLGPKKDSNSPPPSLRSHRSAQGPPPPPPKQTYSTATGSSRESVRLSDPILDFRTDSLADVLDLDWALSQNIDVGGLSVKTVEDIIDMHLPSSSSSSPPPPSSSSANGGLLLLDSPPLSSDSSDSELELNSLLNFSALHHHPPTTTTTTGEGVGDDDGSLDLTVHGIGLPPPDWWSDSINGRFNGGDSIDLIPSLSSRFDDGFHPWAENRNDGIDDVLMAFDAGSCLMDPENLDVVGDGFKLL